MPIQAQAHRVFRGRWAWQGLGEPIALTRWNTSGPVRTFSTSRMAARSSSDDGLLFCVHQAGSGHLRQHDRLAALAPGVGVLYEARSAWEIAIPDRCQNVVLHLPRQSLPMRTREISDGCARAVDRRSPALRLLSDYLGHLFALADSLTEAQRLDAGQAAIDLLVMVLRAAAPSAPVGAAPPDVLLRMMQTHVREHIDDPLLSVTELARRHHISPRHVYELFAKVDATPGAFIREQRLLAARSMLLDPRNERRGVADVAAGAGFADSRTFTRAFKRQFGMSPASWRQEQRARE